jgi:hypothetical protein
VKDLFSLSSTTGCLRSGGVGFGGGELTPSRWKISAVVERFGASLRLPYSPKWESLVHEKAERRIEKRKGSVARGFLFPGDVYPVRRMTVVCSWTPSPRKTAIPFLAVGRLLTPILGEYS